MSFATVSAKLGRIDASTKSIAKELYDAAAKAGHAPWYMWGMGSSSEHATGRALDLMVRNEAAGDWIRNYIWKHRKRLRLQHVIWEQHITSTTTSPGVRRKMADRGSVTENHMDHVHVLFFKGSYQKPSESDAKPKPGTKERKTVSQLADEVIRGLWGNGPERKRRLIAAGYNYNEVQDLVEARLNPNRGRKSIKQLASEVIAGQWGNGDTRKRRLKEAGYDPKAVQNEVNDRLSRR